jgi:mRNA interferase RelE/StbE
LPLQDYLKIQTALLVIASNPYVGKKLKGKYKDALSYRVWPYRIQYIINKNELVVLVIRIDHRQGVYK